MKLTLNTRLVPALLRACSRPTESRWMAAAAVAILLPVALRADLTGTVTLQSGSTFSFDTGATAASGGDILFTGTNITFQGSATGYSFTAVGATEYSGLSQSLLSGFPSSLYTQSAISGGALVVNEVFAVHTIGGNYAKVLVTAVSSSSITFQYDTFGVSGGGGGGGGGSTTPQITAVVNNSSLIPAGFSNSGIAPSTLFVIEGTNLANAGTPSLWNVVQSQLPLTQNGASISVTVGGTTVHPAIYYTCSGALGSASGCGTTAPAASMIAAVLPSGTPTGQGTLTVTYNGTPSAPADIQVVPSALGIDTYNGGTGVITDAVSYLLLTPTSAGKPGEDITLWGTGLGADPGGAISDTTSLSTQRPISANLQIYIGGVPVTNFLYQGGTLYPGVSIIIVQIPASVPTGCYVPVVGVVGNVVSNTVTIPIAPNGGVCSDPAFGITGTTISSQSGQTTTSSGVVEVVQETSSATGTPQTSDDAFALFDRTTSSSSSSSSGIVSPGACLLNQYVNESSSTSTSTGLNAGTITVTGPSGGAVTLNSIPQVTGEYVAQLASGAIPSSGGSFTFNGSGGTDVGSFTATINFPNPILSWTNQSAAANITRTSGLQVTWNGGASGSIVIINGSASASTSGAYGSYTCIAPVSAGSFTVPSYILLGLPAGTGTTSVENATNYTRFSASGLANGGIAIGAVAVSLNSNYQ
jgi:uncharacterized protein (TIGR03437 family)